MKWRTSALAALVGSSLFAFACGGGSDGGGPPATGGTVSGTAVKGPVAGAAVGVFAVSNGTMGAQVGAGTTDAAGHFTVSIGDYAGPLMIQVSGGSYVDEATGTTMTMLAGDVLDCAIPSVAAGASTTGIQVTPLTSMAQARAQAMTGRMTPDNMRTANTAVGTYFMVSDVLHTKPMDPLVAGSGAASTSDERNYGMALAAMSQYAAGIGMTSSSSGFVTAMMKDASDGVMDGMMGSTGVSMTGMGGMMGGMMQSTAGTSGLATAMGTFVGSAMNRSGVPLADMQALMNQLATSNGQLPGAGGAIR